MCNRIKHCKKGEDTCTIIDEGGFCARESKDSWAWRLGQIGIERLTWALEIIILGHFTFLGG